MRKEICEVTYIQTKHAVVAQLVEHQLPKLRVASSSLVYRSQGKVLKISKLQLVSNAFLVFINAKYP